MAEPTKGDGAAPNGSAPWYARFGLYVLTHVAPPTLLSGVLLALVTGWLPFPVLSAFLSLRDDMAQLTREIQALRLEQGKLAVIFEQTLDVQRANCWNTSKTSEDQRRCYRAPPQSGNGR